MSRDYNQCCCWTLKRFSFFFNYFTIIDTDEYLADALFIRHEVRVWFGPEYGRDDTPYRMILCKCRKKDTPKFLAAVRELPNKMLLFGHRDYMDFCTDLQNFVNSAKANGGANRHETNDTSVQAE